MILNNIMYIIIMSECKFAKRDLGGKKLHISVLTKNYVCEYTLNKKSI